jgi:hypothetical protein
VNAGSILRTPVAQSESTHSIEQQRDGWLAILNNFARHVEAKRRV